jgi:single-strand DNA-binding protein
MTEEAAAAVDDPVDGAASPDRLNVGHRNEVTLVGRLAGEVNERLMPSGTPLSSFRLVVRREVGATQGPNIDTLDCVAWHTAVQRVIRSWTAGDLVEVRGAVRRRFWRGGSGSVSRCEIEVGTVRRLARAAPRAPSRRRALATAASSALADQRAGPMFFVTPLSSA